MSNSRKSVLSGIQTPQSQFQKSLATPYFLNLLSVYIPIKHFSSCMIYYLYKLFESLSFVSSVAKPILVMCYLPQVVLAFHAGRLGASLSFMGKGVTYYSSLCLAHLTHEMAVIDPTEVINYSGCASVLECLYLLKTFYLSSSPISCFKS